MEGSWGAEERGRHPGHRSPVAVVVVIVVTSQRRQTAQADGIGEEDLRAGIHPDLQEAQRGWCERKSAVCVCVCVVVVTSQRPQPTLHPRQNPSHGPLFQRSSGRGNTLVKHKRP